MGRRRKQPYDMGAPAPPVLKAGPAGSPSSCGEWIQHAELEGKTLYGWVHNDYGLTWKIEGLMLTAPGDLGAS